MSDYHVTLVPFQRKYKEMPLENARLSCLNEMCSIEPSADYANCMSTGNGFQRVDILGDPYNEELAFMQELLYAPLWAKTPEPPDLTGIMPEIRRLYLKENLEKRRNWCIKLS